MEGPESRMGSYVLGVDAERACSCRILSDCGMSQGGDSQREQVRDKQRHVLSRMRAANYCSQCPGSERKPTPGLTAPKCAESGRYTDVCLKNKIKNKSNPRSEKKITPGGARKMGRSSRASWF